MQGSRRKELLSNNFDCLSNYGSLQKKFTPINLLDKFLHLLIQQDILGEEINLLHNSLKVGITLNLKGTQSLSFKYNVYKVHKILMCKFEIINYSIN